MIHDFDAPADVSDELAFAALRAKLPTGAAAFASPSTRTIETATALGLRPVAEPNFREQNFGDWTGRRHDDLARESGAAYRDFWRAPANSRPPGGESFAEQVVRVRDGLAALPPGDVILVVHSGTIRAALADRARDRAGPGAALCDRSAVADPDRPVDERLAHRRRQPLKCLLWRDEMRRIFVIGIGVGDPDHMTMQAIKALNQVDVFFIPDKGAEKAALRDLRTTICERFIESADYRNVDVDIPARATAGDYLDGVDEWHGRLADIYGGLFEHELAENEVGALLVWGDPAIYDSTLRIIERLRAKGLALDFRGDPRHQQRAGSGGEASHRAEPDRTKACC